MWKSRLLVAAAVSGVMGIVHVGCVGDPALSTAQPSAGDSGTDAVVTPKEDGEAPVTDSGAPDASDAAPLPRRLYAFVTVGKVDGAFAAASGGKPWDAADAICAAEASGAGKTGTFRAWLSYTNGAGTPFNASTRIADGPYYLYAGEDGSAPALIAESKAKLLANGPLVPIGRTASGSPVDFDENTSVAWVWTATGMNGQASGGLDCNGWTDAAATQAGGTGNARVIPSPLPSDWTSLGGRPCNLKRRFYCFEVP